MKRPDVPCKGCADRWVTCEETCHATCDRYAEFQRLNELFKAEMEQRKLGYNEKHWYQTQTGWWRRV